MKFNNTTNFVLPILLTDRVFMSLYIKGVNPFEYMVGQGFKNAYLNDEHYSFENKIFLLFNPEEMNKTFTNFCETTLEQHEEYMDNYDVDENTVMYMYNLPEEYREDVQLLKAGKYSKTSSRFKELFPNKVVGKNGKLQLHANWMILHKHPQWKKTMEDKIGTEIPQDLDLWDVFNEESEIFNYKIELK